MKTLTVVALVALSTSLAAQDTSLKTIHKIFVEKMPNDLDQYIDAEIVRQFAGRIVIVLDKNAADAILRGTDVQNTGVGAAITGRALYLQDNAFGSVSLVDRDEKVVLWSADAGDRSLLLGPFARGGVRKVASRLVRALKKAMSHAR
ncbi:MAG: hypothetical protein ACM3SQ_18430 [Betaproteobacteria bacterium]